MNPEQCFSAVSGVLSAVTVPVLLFGVVLGLVLYPVLSSLVERVLRRLSPVDAFDRFKDDPDGGHW